MIWDLSFSCHSEDLAAQWETYTINNSVGDAGKLTSKALDKLRAQVKRSAAARSKKKSRATTFRRMVSPTPLSKDSAIARFSTPSPLKRSVPSTKDTQPASKAMRLDDHGSKNGSSKKAKGNSVAKMLRSTYKHRKNSGQTVGGVHNPKILTSLATSVESASAQSPRCNIKVLSEGLTAGAMHMYSSPPQRAKALESQLLEIGAAIMQRHNLGSPDEELEPVGMPSQNSVLVCGRVCCEADSSMGSGTLNAASLLLEGSSLRSNGVRVRLDVSKLSTYSLFPGQVVVVRGINPTGQCTVAEEIFSDATLSWQDSPSSALMTAEQKNGAEGNFHMLVAAGPFCVVDDLEYDPLEDFVDAVIKKKPDVVVLVGPFVDTNNQMIKTGNINLDDGDGGLMPVTFLDLFKYRVTTAIQRIIPDVPACRVLVVPSCDDAHHPGTYPQAPFAYEDLLYEGLEEADVAEIKQRVTLLPNPSIVQINEVTLAINSADIMRHILPEDTSLFQGKKPHFQTRLPHHLLAQRSFYPLFPAGASIALDLGRSQHLKLPFKPDVMILASKLNNFAENVDGVLCINPGRLTKGVSAGTYAHLAVKDYEDAAMGAATDAGKGDDSKRKCPFHCFRQSLLIRSPMSPFVSSSA